MSITDEKWVVDADGDVWVEGYGQFGLRAQCPSPKDGYPDVAKAIAVLPEALALLKQLVTTGDDLEFIRDEAESILRRAGELAPPPDGP